MAALCLLFLTGCPDDKPTSDSDAASDAASAKPDSAPDASPAKPRESADAGKKKAEGPPKAKPTELLLERPRTSRELKTTNCRIYLGNRKGTIDALTKITASPKASPSHFESLAKAHHGRGHYEGDYDEISKAIEVATKGLEKKSDHIGLLLARAGAYDSLHKIPQLRKDLAAAEKLRKDHPPVESAKLNLALLMGEPAAIEKVSKPGTDWLSYARAAQIKFKTGDVITSDRYFAIAEVKFKGTSPESLAWLNVQRGLTNLHRGEFERAQVFYKEAVDRCENYPLAIEHLAEIEYLLGNTDKAIELYEMVIRGTNNPEFIGALADVYRDKGDSKKAAELDKKTAERNEELLAKYPEAMYWHAADFYLGAGNNPKKALELLKKNHALRPSPTAKQALAEAQLANDDVKGARKNIDAALASPIDIAELHWTAARVARAEGNDEAMKKHREKALSMNPKIATLEGEL